MSNNDENKMEIEIPGQDPIKTSVKAFREAANNMTRLNQLKPGDTISISDKQFMQSEELTELASEIISDKNIELGPAAVCYLLVYPNISKKRAAKVKKCSRELKYFSGYDYLIEVSGELWDMLDRETRYRLMWHQLLHLNPSYSGKTGKWTMKTRKPQYADYYEIADTQGNNWYKAIQASMSSLEDLDPEKERQVSLF